MEKKFSKRRILKKASILLVEFLGLSLAAALIMIGAFLWRLSSGPINVSFANNYIEQALNNISPAFTVGVMDTELAWEGYNTPIRILAQNVQVLNPSGGQITSVSEVGIDLSIRRLFVGQLVPTKISLFGPELVVNHLEDGAFDINLQSLESEKAAAEPATEEESFIQHLLDELKKPPGGHDAAGLLQEVDINGARIFYRDHMHDFSVTASNADLQITRDQDGILGIATITLDIEGREETFRGEFGYDRELGVYQISAAFINILPTNFIAIAPEKLGFLKQISLPLSLHSYIGLDRYFQPLYIDLEIAGKEGILSLPQFYDEPLSVRHAKADIRYDARTGTVTANDLTIQFYDMLMKAQGKVGFTESLNVYFKGTANLSGLPTDKLANYWPQGLGENARHWVTTRITNGTIDSADITFDMEMPEGDPAQLALNKMSGTINLQGARVDYLPPMPPVEGVSGTATFGPEQFVIKTDAGHINDIVVENSDIVIGNLNTNLPDIAIDLDARGPLSNILHLINNEPLSYAKALGFNPNDFTGDAKVHTSLSFPLLSNLPMEKVTVETNAVLQNITAKNIVMSKTLGAEKLTMLVNNKQLRLEGDGFLANIPGSFIWQEYFEDAAPLRRRIDAQIASPVDRLNNLDIPVSDYASGFAEATVILTSEKENTNTLSVAADLKQANIRIEPLHYQKPVGVDASLSMVLPITDGTLQHINNIVYSAPETTLRGTVSLNDDGGFKNLFFPSFVMPGINASLGLSTLDGTTGYSINIKGDLFDATPFMEKDDTKEDTEADAQKSNDNYVIALDVGTLLLSRKFDSAQPWKNAKGVVHQQSDTIDRIEMDALVGSGDVYLRYTPQEMGHDLRLESNDAGAFLNSIGLSESIRDGVLVIGGKSDKTSPDTLNGAVDMRSFTVVEAPVLARLLNAFSLPGLLELLSNEGITFNRMKSNFSSTGDLLQFREGAAYGSSIGFNFDGNLNTETRAMDIEGTIIPAYQLNRMIGKIPLIGQILSGAKSEGIIAAKFSVQGVGEEANVSVNPLSALTPGILRSIFFDRELDNPETGN